MKNKLNFNDLTGYGLTKSEKKTFFKLYQNMDVKDKIANKNFNPVTLNKLINIKDIITDTKNVTLALRKLVVIKLNGGLGTAIGCKGSKSAIKIKKEKTFLDLIADQFIFMFNSSGIKIPLFLMNSIYTEKQTKKLISPYTSKINVTNFNQRIFPRIDEKTHLPLSQNNFGNDSCYPPGHGEIFEIMYQQGILKKLLSKGYEYLFISNLDNLCATVDEKIFSWFLNQKIDFLMEVTKRIDNDLKGGIIVEYENRYSIIELSQLSLNQQKKILNKKNIALNTNNIWIKISSLLNKLSKSNSWQLPVVINKKKIKGKSIIQLETTMGGAISQFKNSKLLRVDRNRFLPIKTNNDLFIIQSDLFKIKNGTLVYNGLTPKIRMPIIQLGKTYNLLEDYLKRLPQIPDIKELTSLKVEGDIYFSKNIKLIGDVKIISKFGKLQLPSGMILKNKIVIANSKNLNQFEVKDYKLN